MFKYIAFLSIFSSFLFSKPLVTTSILPHAYFIQTIAGDTLEVLAVIPPNANEATYEPKPKDMKNLTKAEIYFKTGVPFEHAWLQKFQSANKNMKIVDMAKNIDLLPMEPHHHDHDGEHEHKHHGDNEKISLDPHIWTDPILAKIQATNIADALIEQYPHFKSLYEENLKKLHHKMDELDLSIKKELYGIKNNKFMVYHPSWGYFAHRYGLEQIAIEIEGKDPKPSVLAKIINEAKEEGIKIIFVQKQFSQKSAEMLAKSIGGKVVSIDPLAKDWDSNLYKIAKILKDELDAK